MKNSIIVEGITDKKFLESFLAYLQATFPKEYFQIDSIQHAKGQDAILSILNALKIRIKTGQTQNIGIILDADQDGIVSKIEQKINPAIEKAFGTKNVLTVPNQIATIEYEGRSIHVFCYIFNVNGQGELEDMLKSIRKHPNTTCAACLEAFVDCIGGCNLAYPEKEYNKNFVYFYGYDCLQQDSSDSETLRTKLKGYEYYHEDYWDFEHESLHELKRFLRLFGETPA